MELGLSLGDAPKFLKNKGQKQQESGINMALSLNTCAVENQGKDENEISEEDGCSKFNLPQNPLHLNLLPLSPRRRPCFSHNGIWESGNMGLTAERGGSSDDDDDGDNVNTAARNRKKLRLSKQQSAFLEQSFKEHHTLNHKQKLILAKHLNLRHRQVEVWFQNRRARTKVKQTEVDYEYLKRCCDTLSEENRRLHKELQELRALKTSNPFYMQMPATTLTMCLSCAAATATTAVEALPLNRSKFHPFAHTPNTTRNMHIDNGSGP